jgi:lactoylglutathione lyase
MAVRKLEHVGVMVSDIEVSVDFYQNVLGLDLLDSFKANPAVTLAYVAFSNDEILTLANGSKYIFFKGPDGETLELFQPSA